MSAHISLNIEDAIRTINDMSRKSDGCVVVAIVGGTNSGKTTITKRIVAGDDKRFVHLPQDTFQLGYDYSGIETSRYRADDPNNFALDECVAGLASLKSGKATTVPLITPLRYERHGTWVAEPKSLIIWEGAYAVLTIELRDLTDTIFYVDAPYAVRIIRRIARSIEERGGIGAPEQAATSANHMLSSVLLAEKDFVITQKQYAKYVIEFDDKLATSEFENIEKLTANIENETQLGELYGARQVGEGLLELYEKGISIVFKNKQIYSARLDTATMSIAKENFDYILNS